MLPRDVQQAIDRYESDKASGRLVFTHDGLFAAMPPDHVGGWIQSFLAAHLPDMDAYDGPEDIDYGRGMRHNGPVARRADGQETPHG